MRNPFSTTLALLALSGFPLLSRAEIVYERDIAPILRTYCAGCHNDAENENGFSVETFAGLRKGGDEKGSPVRPGHPDDSFLIKSLEHNVRPHMPPKDEPQVPTSEIALLKKWIALGANGPKKDSSILQNLVVPKILGANGQPPVAAAAWSPDGKHLALAIADKIELRGSLRGKARRTLPALPGKTTALHFSPDGSLLVAAGGITGLNGLARLWNLGAGLPTRDFGGHTDTLYDAEFSPDGQLLATAGYDRVIRLWQVQDAKLLRMIPGHNGAIFDLAFDPSGAVLASASADQTVKLWRVSDGLRLDTLSQPQGELAAVAFSPNGQHIIAAGADKRIHLWQFLSRAAPALNPPVHSRFAHEAGITAFAITADGLSLITAAADRTLKSWSLPALVEQTAFGTQPDLVAALAPHPRRNAFVAARMDGSIQSFSLKTPRPKKAPAEAKPVVQASASTASTNLASFTETEPNHTPAQASLVTLPAEIRGAISEPGDVDLFRFRARAGEELTALVTAAQAGSALDSRIEILTASGQPIEQVVLQAVRDSWFTFRGKDSDTADDFRLHNWAEMELNEYLYANGEVSKLWLYPRGPDSGFKVYPGESKRQTAFFTTAITHALNEPCYIVAAFPAGSQPPPNGLPIFRLNFENDDDPSRRAGADSLLHFKAPAAAEYLVRVTDVRGFGGTNFPYTLTLRETRPDFSVTLDGSIPAVSPGSGREIRFLAKRFEGFDGPIQIDITGLPTGFSASSPIEIEAGQMAAVAAIYASSNAPAPATNALAGLRITARATIGGRGFSHPITPAGELKLAKAPRVTVEILPGSDRASVREIPGQPLEFTIRPGQTISARVRAARLDFKERIELGNEDSGRNLPHGVYVDNIGLNGLLIVEGETERDFFITASKIAAPGVRTFHLRAKGDGGQASLPALLRVLPSVTRVSSK